MASPVWLAFGPGTIAASAGWSRQERDVDGHALASLGDLLTYDYDNGRSGDDPVGPKIATLSARPVWDDGSLDGAVYGEPLIYDGTVYVATENDTVYALNASNGALRWRVHVGAAVSTSVADSAPTLGGGCGDINPLGITGTPVIDPTANEIFVAEETYQGGHHVWESVRHWLVAVSLASHRELWHRDIDPPRPNHPSTYFIAAEQQRPALTLYNGRLYTAYGGLEGDCGQYHGYVVGLAESGTGPLLSYQVPTAREGGIWGTSGIVVSSQGDLYVTTGNGSSSDPAHFDEGNAVVELSPTLSRLGVWAPRDWVKLNDQDWDLGSAGPIQVPGTTLLFAAGKPAGNNSFASLMHEGALGGVGHGAFSALLCRGGGVYGADASDVLGARILIFSACGGGTEAVQINPSSLSFQRVWSPSTGSPDGPPIVAGGLVWALDWNGNALYGMNPANGHVVVERTTDGLNHFATPSAAEGMLFVPTYSGVEAFRAIG
jgi:polyvinyl alcohol dehydrogenase (cytochrome)